MMNWDQELLKAKEKSPTPDKTSVVKGEDKEGKYEEYIIRHKLPATRALANAEAEDGKLS